MWPIQLAFLLFIVLGYSCPVWLCVTFLHFSRDRSKWSSPSFSKITFQNFQGISDPLSKVSKFQQHTVLHFQCSFLLVYFLHWSPTFWLKKLLVECCISHGHPGFNFTCTSYIIRYNATKAVEIFHILRLFLIYRHLCRRLLLSDSHYIRFSTFISSPFHLLISVSLSVMPHSTVCFLASSRSYSVYFTLRIASPLILEYPNPTGASLVRYGLYKLNRTKHTLHPCLTPLPVFTLHVFP